MKKYALFTMLFVAAALISFGFLNKGPEKSDELYVLVKYKAQPDKEKVAVAELRNLIAHVKEEPHFGNITVFSDPADPTNILLYEQWKSEEYYKGDHMKTAHLQKFITDSRNFLAGPPEITFWKVAE